MENAEETKITYIADKAMDRLNHGLTVWCFSLYRTIVN